MTDYIIEKYARYGRVPYDKFRGSLPDGYKPRYANRKDAFNFRLTETSGKCVIRYASNGNKAGETYVDKSGNVCIRWVR